MLGSRSRVAFLLGVGCAVVGVVGSVFFGWRFGGPTDPVVLVFAIMAVVAAIVVTLRRSSVDR